MNEEPFNGEFAKKLSEAVEAFFALDEVCDKVKEKQICDAVGVKCDTSCKIYTKKEKLLRFMEECIKAIHTAPVLEPEGPMEEPSSWRPEPEMTPERTPQLQPAEPEKPRERLCPSCGQKAARPESKYCDFCGGEF